MGRYASQWDCGTDVHDRRLAIDAGAGAGTGIDTIHIYAYPSVGDPIWIGAPTLGYGRPDVAAAFGSQFHPSGFALTTSALAPGTYTLVVYPHSWVTNSFSQAQSVYVTVLGGHQNALELPYNNATVSQPFTIHGWAVDASSPTGPGIDTLHIWAYPASGAPAVFVDVAAYGINGPDVTAWLQDGRFGPSGFVQYATGLSPGVYLLAVFPHSSYTGAFGPAMTAWITVQ